MEFSCLSVGWQDTQVAAMSFEPDGVVLAERDDEDFVIQATGYPRAGVIHAEAAIAAGKHVVMVNVEAHAMVGPLLTKKANAAGFCYSIAYGDQTALVSEMVDWARATGFDVTAAGTGTKYLPMHHNLTLDDV